MKTGTKRKIVLVLLAIAFLFASCNEEKKVSTENENDAQPEATVAVGVASGTAFQGLDEVRDPETGAVIEDAVTYISMENNQQIELKVTLAQSTEMYKSLEFRMDNSSAFRVGTQSPANSDAVTLQPGTTTSVYIKSSYNTPEEPRRQTSMMRVVGISSENEETTLRKFQVGSYKKLSFDLAIVKVKYSADAHEVTDGGKFWEIGEEGYRDSARKILAPAIVEVRSVQFSEIVVPYDVNGNGIYDEVSKEETPEQNAIDAMFRQLRQESVFQDGVITVALVDDYKRVFRVLGKTGPNSIKIKAQYNEDIPGGTKIFLGQEQEVYDRHAELMVSQSSLIDSNTKELFFTGNLGYDDPSGFVVTVPGWLRLGGARTYDSRKYPEYLNYVAQRPIIINSGSLNANMGVYASYGMVSSPDFNEDWPVPLHEASHSFGLRDVSRQDNLMSCNAGNFLEPLKKEGASGLILRGRPVIVSKTGVPGCPPLEPETQESQWDEYVREPRWGW